MAKYTHEKTAMLTAIGLTIALIIFSVWRKPAEIPAIGDAPFYVQTTAGPVYRHYYAKNYRIENNHITIWNYYIQHQTWQYREEPREVFGAIRITDRVIDQLVYKNY